ncbi:MAG: exo-alpha-sialidase [Planctomycetota bacterium]
MSPRAHLVAALSLLVHPAAALVAQAPPGVQLDAAFSDHMVVQRGVPIPVRGTAPANARVEVSFGETNATTTADSTGRWEAALPAQGASFEPRTLTAALLDVAPPARAQARDVLVGDVWLCTGQSNMAWRVEQSAEADDVLAHAPVRGLRLLDLRGRLRPDGTRYDLELLRSLSAETFYTSEGWARADRAAAASYSAVAFTFGRRLTQALGVPVGLIHSAVGGAPMEAFVPADPADDAWMKGTSYPRWCRQRLRENLAAWFESPTGPQPHHPFEPGFLYDAGVRPLRRVPLTGVAWYQGESNATDTAGSAARDPAVNEAMLRRLIGALRDNWGRPGLPFLMVQLPGIERDWEAFREVQDRVARTTAACELAVTIDLGAPGDVHPRRKVPVAERLAAAALRGAYGRPGAAAPRFESFRIEGRRAVVRFDAQGPLRTLDHAAPRAFEIAGEDRVFWPALVQLQGARAQVWSPDVAAPVAVRYAYEDDPDTNVVDREGLPLAPFRTDDWRDPRRARAAVHEGFEDAAVGPLRRHQGPAGTWRADAGHAEVTDRFAHDGRRCLHLLGGVDRTVEWTLPTPTPTHVQLRAERWTRRSPFAFRVQARVRGRWRDVFDGDQVKVGARFLSKVGFAVPDGAKKLRLRCTSPDASGLLVDAVTATPPEDMSVTACLQEPWTAPMLLGRFSTADRVRLQVRGAAKPRRVVACTVTIPAAALAYVEAVRALGDEREPEETLQLRGNQTLQSGANDVEVAVRWRTDMPWEACRAVRITSIELDDGSAVAPTPAAPAPARVSAVVRAAGQDGVHTARIPGLTTTNAGTLIAVYDHRYRSSGDLPGDIDVGMSRSTDGGRSWSPSRVILDMGDDPEWRHDGVGDPAVLVDRETGRIWVAATWSHGDRSWNGSGPGMVPEETGQLMLTYSDDDGLTWSEPVNITAQVKDPKWRFVLQGPGRGITMQDGTLVFAAQYRSAPDGPHQGKPFSTILWSKDRGDSWHIGTGVKVDTTEAQVVELDDGVLMINCRDNRRGARSVYTTRDLGETWQIHPTSRSALVEPVCMASLLRVDHETLGRLLLFSNPATSAGRFDMTVKVSRDDGASWPASMWTLYDQRKGFGYSCLTQIDADHVGVLYEGARELYFARFAIADLVR